MQDFIKSAIEYIDFYQSRNLAHTCKEMRDLIHAHEHAPPFALTPINSMLARSSLTSLAGVFDGSREKHCHPAVAQWADSVLQSKQQLPVIMRAICRYDDIEFMRAIVSYVRNVTQHHKGVRSFMWNMAMCKSTPSSAEIIRINDLCANVTQSTRIFAYICSRDVTDYVRLYPTDDVNTMYQHMIIDAIYTNNIPIARAILNTRKEDAAPINVEVKGELVGYDMFRLCESRGVRMLFENCTWLDRLSLSVSPYPQLEDINGMSLSNVLTIIAMNIHEPVIISTILDQSQFAHDTWSIRDIFSVCCHANRLDIADMIIDRIPVNIILQQPFDIIEFDPYKLASLRDLALRHIDDHRLFAIYAAISVLHESCTPTQIRAIMSPDNIATFARVISQVCVLDTAQVPPRAISISDASCVDTFCRITSVGMYDLWREFGFTIGHWHNIIHAIMRTHNVDEIKHMTESLANITIYDIVRCVDVMTNNCLTHAHPYPSVRALDQESICYLVGRINQDESTQRNMFMLGMLLNSRATMLESHYILRTDDIDDNFTVLHSNFYSCENPAISEFFDSSQRTECYSRMLLSSNTSSSATSMLLHDMSKQDIIEVISHIQSATSFCFMDHMTELIATTLLRKVT